MSFCIKPNVCKKCGKPLTLFEGWYCFECEKAEKDKCKNNCEECEYNDGDCCRILFEQSLEQESKTDKIIKMRDATPEERESVDKHVKSISKPTGVNFWDEQESYICDTCKHKDAEWDTEPCDGCCGNHSGYEPYDDNEPCEEIDFVQEHKKISVTLDLTPSDDAVSRILKRMWNCRGKHTTSIDKVKMEQIIRDELPPVGPHMEEPMREFTKEEAKAYSKALDKMYKPTGFNVFNEPCDDLINQPTVVKFEGTNMACMGGDEIMKEFENNTQQNNDVIGKIRDEIERLHCHPKLDFIKNDEVVDMALDIIDKYRA